LIIVGTTTVFMFNGRRYLLEIKRLLNKSIISINLYMMIDKFVIFVYSHHAHK
jgi:hypothetical protein